MFSTPILDTILAILCPYRQLVQGLISLSSTKILCCSTALPTPVVSQPIAQLQTFILLAYLLSLFHCTFLLERDQSVHWPFFYSLWLLYLLRLLTTIPNSDSTDHFATTFFFLESLNSSASLSFHNTHLENLYKSISLYSLTIFRLLNSTGKKISQNRRR